LPEDDLRLLAEAALAAGALALDLRDRGLTVTEKPGGEGPVTNADLAVDDLLRRHLAAARPSYGWLSEETPDAPDRLTRRRVFIVDPIDGTRGFIDGQNNFALALSVVEDGVPVTGIVHMPARGRTYAAAAGRGATLNGQPIAVSAVSDPAEATVLINRAQMSATLWPRGVPPFRQTFRPSLAYRMALAAEGRFDAMLTLRDAWEWDVAAGAVIAAEAGARVTDRQGRPHRFNSPAAKSPGVLAAPPGLHAAILSRIG
jgi:myo-inositol-1(or 4)-monophosphatase